MKRSQHWHQSDHLVTTTLHHSLLSNIHYFPTFTAWKHSLLFNIHYFSLLLPFTTVIHRNMQSRVFVLAFLAVAVDCAVAAQHALPTTSSSATPSPAAYDNQPAQEAF